MYASAGSTLAIYLLTAVASNAAALQYTFTDINNDPAFSNIPCLCYYRANGINGAGQIVGSFVGRNAGEYAEYGFLDSSGTFTTTNIVGSGVNDAGEIVGRLPYLYSNAVYAVESAAGTVTIFGGPPGADASVAGINNAGQDRRDLRGLNRLLSVQYGYLDSGGIFTTIRDPQGTDTVVSGVNNSGQMVDPTRRILCTAILTRAVSCTAGVFSRTLTTRSPHPVPPSPAELTIKAKSSERTSMHLA